MQNAGVNRIPRPVAKVELIKPSHFEGKWDTVAGQRMRVLALPLVGLVAIFRPSGSSWPRLLFPCYVEETNLMVPLGWLGPLDATLVLSPGTKIDGRVPILVPELQSGPESWWEEEGFGFPWVYPLAIFRREKQ